MATTYTQTIEFSVWKEHTCSSCGTVYRYLFKRQMKGEGNTPEKASENAEKAVVNALEHEVDMHPCPECGLYQPDMIASRRASRHWWTFWAGVPVIGLLLILVLSDVFTMTTGSLLAGISTMLLALTHILLDLWNPNRNVEANQRLGRQREKAGDLWVPEEKQPRELSEDRVSTGIISGHYIAWMILAVAVICFFLPVVLPIVTGMKSNPGWYPDFVGPGDSTYIYFPNKISSVKRYWNGSPRVTITNASDLGGPVQITATSKNATWGNTISVKSSEKNSSFTPWARIQLPANSNLVGNTLQMRIDMTVNYPQVIGTNIWGPKTENISTNATLMLSSAGAGGLFKMSFWAGFLGGSALLFLGGVLLPIFSKKFKEEAHKTSIFVPEGQRPPIEDDEEDDEDYDDRPRKRSKRDDDYDDEEYDRPRRKLRDEEYDDDYEDRPRKRSRRDDEYDDEEERPRKRRRSDD